MRWIKKTGLDKLLPELLKTRIYFGSSSGGIVIGQKIPEKCRELYESDPQNQVNIDGLGIVNFTFLSHYCEEGFPLTLTNGIATELAKELGTEIYAIDDQTAIVINGDHLKVVTEGKWKKFSP